MNNPSQTFSWPSIILRCAAAGAWLLLCSLPTFVAFVLLIPWRGSRIRVGNLYAKAVCWPGLWLFGMRVNVVNAERLDAQPAIYVANHTSTLDLFMGSALCPVGACGVAKKEIARLPVFGQIYWLSGHLLIDRGNPEKARASLASLVDLVRPLGLSIWIWPEGTRSRDGQLKTFKKGFVHIACATGLPVVPVILQGACDRWPGKAPLTSGSVNVTVLEAIDTSAWTPDAAGFHAEFVEAIFRRALA
jgi:1-acyl-sn-glycerol-3-phosphate acyltransferase